MISREEVLQLAALARLTIPEGEIEGLQKDISAILDYVSHVSEASIGARAEVPLQNVMREDVPRDAGDPLGGKEEALKASFPTREGDYNAVRKILQKDA